MRPRILSTLTLALLLGLATFPATAEEAMVQSPRVEVGEEAPPFTLPTTEGQTLSPESLRGDKPLVLTFFRGTW